MLTLENFKNHIKLLTETTSNIYLSFQKVYPKENYFDSTKHKFYIYCYLNPFKPGVYEYTIQGKKITFGYEPLYIGKASSAHGYRHNQHIAEFLKGRDSEEPQHENMVMTYNMIKSLKFSEIEKEMNKHDNPNLPSSWEEYQKNWIIILQTFDIPNNLIIAEKEFIRTIGTIGLKTGPLTNGQIG